MKRVVGSGWGIESVLGRKTAKMYVLGIGESYCLHCTSIE